MEVIFFRFYVGLVIDISKRVNNGDEMVFEDIFIVLKVGFFYWIMFIIEYLGKIGRLLY